MKLNWSVLKGSRFIRILFIEQVSVFITRWEQKFDKTVAVELEIWIVVQLKADFEKGILVA